MVKIKFSWVDILAVILFLLSVYLILLRLFGHSPTEIEIMIMLFSLIITLIFKGYTEISKLNREVGEIKIGVMNEFKKVTEDMQMIKNKLKIR